MKPVLLLLMMTALSYGVERNASATGLLVTREIQWAEYWAGKYGVPPDFVAAIIDVESGWQPQAVSLKGAAGLMQLMPQTAYRFGVINRFDIAQNLEGGVAYLAALIRRFGWDLRLVAAAYYAGEARIGRAGLYCSDPDVYRYVCAVRRAYCTRLRKKREKVQ